MESRIGTPHLAAQAVAEGESESAHQNFGPASLPTLTKMPVGECPPGNGVLIKGCTAGERKKVQGILAVSVNSQALWIWAKTGEFADRLADTSQRPTHLNEIQQADGTGEGASGSTFP
jgi:hypothetical protein